MANKLEVALAFAAQGFKIFPIKAGAKSPPLVSDWPKQATTSESKLRVWWTAWPDANIGIHCEGLLVVDVDVNKGGTDSLNELDVMLGLPLTSITYTPSGGRHLFYTLPAGHPGVPNRVQDLGPGLDVRSTGGYVVAPGSVVPAGEYTFQFHGLAPAPGWLVARCGVAGASQAGKTVDVPPAPESLVDRAVEWLSGRSEAIEGQGGDAHTYATACYLRDMGLSIDQAYYAMLDNWNPRCAPPWDPDELRTKVLNAYRYAAGDPGAKAALPDEFPVVSNPHPAESIDSTGPQTGKLETFDEFADAEVASAGYVIKGMLSRASYSQIYGAPGEGKTFVALDMAYHVAAGMEWNECRVHAGPVLYLAYEGVGGLRKRAKALRKQYARKGVPLYIVGTAANLRDLKGQQQIADVISKMPKDPVLIMIDTFARALMGGDENSAQDVGAFNTAVAKLIKATGACVTIIHHSGKDKTRGARGSSALLGALDTEIEIDNKQILSHKQRDCELHDAIGFKLVPTDVGVDADGEPVTSCVVQPAGIVPGDNKKPLTGNYEHGWLALKELGGEANTPVSRSKLVKKMQERGIKSRSNAYKVVDKLRDWGWITVEDEIVTRRMD